MKSTRILKVFVKLWFLIITMFLFIDAISSFIGIYTLFPKESNPFFKIAISFGISVSAVIANGVGKIFRVLAKEGYSVLVWSVKSSYMEIPVTSPVVAWCVTILPPLLAFYDWFTSFVGTCLLFSGFGMENIQNIWGIFAWFVSLWNSNVIAAIAILITTILSSCAPFLIIQLGESESHIKFMAETLEEQRKADEKAIEHQQRKNGKNKDFRNRR